LKAVLQELRKRELQSLLVEGGSEIAGAFIDAKLVDKVTFIYAPIILGGRIAPNAIGGSGAESLTTAMELKDITIHKLAKDIELTGYPSF
jgi:diaminohydroxyphosphoribosylaminopyrimidine deaminase/5-amino-6-(5-phosphoribosylamino)uracil reductase